MKMKFGFGARLIVTLALGSSTGSGFGGGARSMVTLVLGGLAFSGGARLMVTVVSGCRIESRTGDRSRLILTLALGGSTGSRIFMHLHCTALTLRTSRRENR